MDSKITKKRLSNFLSYEWIVLIIFCVLSIIVWELVYTMTSVRLTVGQKFKFYYDYDLYSGANSTLVSHLKEDEAFSYDVQNISAEWLLEANDLLSTRLFARTVFLVDSSLGTLSSVKIMSPS